MEVKGKPSQSDSGRLAPPDGLCTGKACNCGKVPCGMYLFDHRMGERRVCTGWGGCLTLREWFVHNLTVSETGLRNPAIDGCVYAVWHPTQAGATLLAAQYFAGLMNISNHEA